jgi:hypothetical protein
VGTEVWAGTASFMTLRCSGATPGTGIPLPRAVPERPYSVVRRHGVRHCGSVGESSTRGAWRARSGVIVSLSDLWSGAEWLRYDEEEEKMEMDNEVYTRSSSQAAHC